MKSGFGARLDLTCLPSFFKISLVFSENSHLPANANCAHSHRMYFVEALQVTLCPGATNIPVEILLTFDSIIYVPYSVKQKLLKFYAWI